MRRQIDYLLYNVETGEVNDIFSKLLPENFEIENVIFDKRGKHIIIQEFNGGSVQGLYYLLNIKSGKIVNCGADSGFCRGNNCYKNGVYPVV